MLPVRMLSTCIKGLKDPPGDSELPQFPEAVEVLCVHVRVCVCGHY